MVDSSPGLCGGLIRTATKKGDFENAPDAGAGELVAAAAEAGAKDPSGIGLPSWADPAGGTRTRGLNENHLPHGADILFVVSLFSQCV
jgi:hypothetical protein